MGLLSGLGIYIEADDDVEGYKAWSGGGHLGQEWWEGPGQAEGEGGGGESDCMIWIGYSKFVE